MFPRQQLHSNRGTVFSRRSVPRSYKQNKLGVSDFFQRPSGVEAESNTSTVTLRVVGGDEKGSLESETENTVTSSTRLGPVNDCVGECQEQL
jgi:hypothetical protein